MLLRPLFLRLANKPSIPPPSRPTGRSEKHPLTLPWGPTASDRKAEEQQGGILFPCWVRALRGVPGLRLTPPLPAPGERGVDAVHPCDACPPLPRVPRVPAGREDPRQGLAREPSLFSPADAFGHLSSAWTTLCPQYLCLPRQYWY